LREEVGLTQAALAERAGMSERAISDIERGEKQPRKETLRRLIGALEGEARRLPDQQAQAFRARLTACLDRFQAETRHRLARAVQPAPAAAQARAPTGSRWRLWGAGAALLVVLLGSALLVGNGLGRNPAPAPGPTTVSLPGKPTPVVPVLTTRDSGVDVQTLQLLLRHRGFSQLQVTGSFDPDTEQAVRTFQGESGLLADGVVGPQTWEKLLVNVREGSLGDAVLAAQVQLNRKQAAGLDENGRFDATMRAAVLAFQQRARITVDGIVGPETWQHLLATPVGA
jgi:peptidoglycan hydrolase-like protein with peptidoglycan-binding domain/DNA-binding XRE family transcriptional regulator